MECPTPLGLEHIFMFVEDTKLALRVLVERFEPRGGIYLLRAIHSLLGALIVVLT